MISLNGNALIKKQIGGDDFIVNRIFTIWSRDLDAFEPYLRSLCVSCNWTKLNSLLWRIAGIFSLMFCGVGAFCIIEDGFALIADKLEPRTKKKTNNFL